MIFPISGRAIVWVGQRPVVLAAGGRPTNLDNGRAKAYCVCSRCELGLFGYLFSRLSFLFSFSLSLGWMDDLGFYILFNRI